MPVSALSRYQILQQCELHPVQTSYILCTFNMFRPAQLSFGGSVQGCKGAQRQYQAPKNQSSDKTAKHRHSKQQLLAVDANGTVSYATILDFLTGPAQMMIVHDAIQHSIEFGKQLASQQSTVPSSYMASTNSKLPSHTCKIDIKAHSSTTSCSTDNPSSESLCTQPATTPVVESSLPIEDNAVSAAEVTPLSTAASTECALAKTDHMPQPYSAPQQTSQRSSSPLPEDTTTNSLLLLTPEEADNSPEEPTDIIDAWVIVKLHHNTKIKPLPATEDTNAAADWVVSDVSPSCDTMEATSAIEPVSGKPSPSCPSPSFLPALAVATALDWAASARHKLSVGVQGYRQALSSKLKQLMG